jgi:hypothetical protein
MPDHVHADNPYHPCMSQWLFLPRLVQAMAQPQYSNVCCMGLPNDTYKQRS